MSMKILAALIKMFDFGDYSTKPKNATMIQTNQSMEKRKMKMGGVAIEEFIGLKPKMYLYLVFGRL